MVERPQQFAIVIDKLFEVKIQIRFRRQVHPVGIWPRDNNSQTLVNQADGGIHLGPRPDFDQGFPDTSSRPGWNAAGTGPAHPAAGSGAARSPGWAARTAGRFLHIADHLLRAMQSINIAQVKPRAVTGEKLITGRSHRPPAAGIHTHLPRDGNLRNALVEKTSSPGSPQHAGDANSLQKVHLVGMNGPTHLEAARRRLGPPFPQRFENRVHDPKLPKLFPLATRHVRASRVGRLGQGQTPDMRCILKPATDCGTRHPGRRPVVSRDDSDQQRITSTTSTTVAAGRINARVRFSQSRIPRWKMWGEPRNRGLRPVRDTLSKVGFCQDPGNFTSRFAQFPCPISSGSADIAIPGRPLANHSTCPPLPIITSTCCKRPCCSSCGTNPLSPSAGIDLSGTDLCGGY